MPTVQFRTDWAWPCAGAPNKQAANSRQFPLISGSNEVTCPISDQVLESRTRGRFMSWPLAVVARPLC